MHIKLEYVWLDGYMPEANFRSKTKIISSSEFQDDPSQLPVWSFDGSSTEQADGTNSDCLLKPIRIYRDRSRKHAYLVLCEVQNADGTPHTSNSRSKITDREDLWIGFEQEYTLMKSGRPTGFPESGFPAPQGEYYCGVGNGKVSGRAMVEEHLNLCLSAGITLTGINAEVMIGQWEYQVFAKGAKKAADDLMMSRFLLERVSEQFDLKVELHPKPVEGDWNGSGMHTNFSTSMMREVGGEKFMNNICEAFASKHVEHIVNYGSNNELRLTGLHETQHIKQFSCGESDR